MYYQNRSVLLASKHKKEQAVAQVFLDKLLCTLNVHEFDTDQFGTFTGEIARTSSPYDTCLLKAKTAAEHFDYTLALASEGSFGPHPLFPFVSCGHEIMVFIDREHDWTISEQLVTQQTNYETLTINKQTELDAFLERVKFPSHALIIQSASANKYVIAKGIQDLSVLNHYLSLGFQHQNELLLVTDMRAMMNPTRMQVIGELAEKLTSRIATSCPQCACPGFGFDSTDGALPCSLCGSSTALYEKEIWKCMSCDYCEYKTRHDGLLAAEPTYCHFCNP